MTTRKGIAEPKGPVTQDWVHGITFMQQTVLLAAVRGPDGVSKYHPAKFLLRWYRRCVLVSAMDGKVLMTPYHFGGGSFTGPSYSPTQLEHDWEPQMDEVVGKYIREIDSLPHHAISHYLGAFQILGCKHPVEKVRNWWRRVYERLVQDLNLRPESEADMDSRLGDDRSAWLARNDVAKVD